MPFMMRHASRHGNTTMNYAIIAAGEGSRLAAEGIDTPKPLVKVAGECLVDRLIRVFMSHGADSIAVLCNERDKAVAQHLGDISDQGLDGQTVPLRFRAKNTPSSMHSLHELHQLLGDGPFCLTTVDTVFPEREFADYIDCFLRLTAGGGCHGVMGVTDFVDDEKPLYVETDDDNAITGFYDDPHGCRYVSAGIYGLTPAVWPILDACVDRGEQRMRNFQRALIAGGLTLRAFSFSQVIDIDHAKDLEMAGQLIKTGHV